MYKNTYLFKNFVDSVIELSSNLPQWNSEDIDRVNQSAISSLFEEAGEISGLISKYRIRKHYWKAPIISLNREELVEIETKFIDEAGDLLWVIVCTIYNVYYKEVPLHNNINIEDKIKNCNKYNLSLEESLFDVIRDISIFRQNLLFNDSGNFSIINSILDILDSYGNFVYQLYIEYDITFDKILEHNINKLSNRYTKEGERKDGN